MIESIYSEFYLKNNNFVCWILFIDNIFQKKNYATDGSRSLFGFCTIGKSHRR